MGFHARLAKAWATSGSMLCVGLDPDPVDVPGAARRRARRHRAVLHGDRRRHRRPGVRVQAAVRPLRRAARRAGSWKPSAGTSASAIPTWSLVLDAKRGDVGSTAEHYAREAFGRYAADAVTVNPYLGTDAAAPFLAAAACSRCATPATRQRRAAGPRRRRRAAVRAGGARWSPSAGAELGECGLVVGATYPEQLGARAPDRRRPADPRARHRRAGR